MDTTRARTRSVEPNPYGSGQAPTLSLGGWMISMSSSSCRRQDLQLNRTGARLWELLEAGHDLQQAQAQLLLEFDVDEQLVRREVNTLVAELVAKGLLKPDVGS